MQGAPLALSGNERERVERVDRLVASGTAGLPSLIELLDEPSWSVRRAVVSGIASLGEASIAPLCHSLKTDRKSEARIAATVDALVACAADVTAAVSALGADPDPAVVADVAQILGRRRDPKAVPTLALLARHADDNVAVASLEALGRIGGRAAVDPLVAAVRSGSFFRTFPAIDVLGRSGDPRAVEPLAELLTQPHFAMEAARALGKTSDRAAVEPLMKLLARAGESAARVAVQALADLQARHRERFGNAQPIDAAILAADPERRQVHRLVQALSGAEVSEQIAVCSVLGALGGDGAASALSQFLDGPEEVADAAAAALRKLGRGSDWALVRALVEGDSARRRALLPIIGRGGAAQDIALCLSDPDAGVRALTAETLGRLGNHGAVPALFSALEDPDPIVGQAALGAIQALGSTVTERLALDAWKTGRFPVRRAALRILGYFGYPSALEPFLEALNEADPRLRDAAMQGLALLEDPRAFEALLKASASPEEKTRAAALRALGQAPLDDRATALLLRSLKDPDAWVRYYASQSLGRLQIEAAAGPIAELLGDEAGHVRASAVEALSHLQSDVAAKALRTAADSPEPDVRRAALVGLGLSRRLDGLPRLLAAAREADPSTRLVALSSLAGFDGAEVTAALGDACNDLDEGVRTAARGFLASQRGPEATRRLVALLADPALRPLVQPALSLPIEGRIEGLLLALQEADDERAPDLASALARMQLADGELALIEAMRSPNPAARKAAAGSLSVIGSRASLGVLQRASTDDADAEVRRVCALLLAQ